MLFKEIEPEFKLGFMQMSQKDEQSLDVHKKTFKEEKRRYTIATFALKTFAEEIQNWRPALGAIQYMNDRKNQNTNNAK